MSAAPQQPTLLPDGVAATPHEVEAAIAEYAEAAQHAPPSGCDPDAVKLFIGNIPKHLNAAQLRPVFERFGVVVDLAVACYGHTFKRKGSAFLWYAKRQAAVDAMLALHGTVCLLTREGYAARSLTIRPARSHGLALRPTAPPQLVAWPGQQGAPAGATGWPYAAAGASAAWDGGQYAQWQPPAYPADLPPGLQQQVATGATVIDAAAFVSPYNAPAPVAAHGGWSAAPAPAHGRSRASVPTLAPCSSTPYANQFANQAHQPGYWAHDGATQQQQQQQQQHQSHSSAQAQSRKVSGQSSDEVESTPPSQPTPPSLGARTAHDFRDTSSGTSVPGISDGPSADAFLDDTAAAVGYSNHPAAPRGGRRLMGCDLAERDAPVDPAVAFAAPHGTPAQPTPGMQQRSMQAELEAMVRRMAAEAYARPPPHGALAVQQQQPPPAAALGPPDSAVSELTALMAMLCPPDDPRSAERLAAAVAALSKQPPPPAATSSGYHPGGHPYARTQQQQQQQQPHPLFHQQQQHYQQQQYAYDGHAARSASSPAYLIPPPPRAASAHGLAHTSSAENPPHGRTYSEPAPAITGPAARPSADGRR